MATLLNNKSIFIFPRYTHIVKPTLKYIYLSLDDEGQIIIKSPKVSQEQIEQLLLKKASWIRKAQEIWHNKKKEGTLSFNKENKIYFLGKSYPLSFKKHDKKRTTFTFNTNTFYLYYYTLDANILQKPIDSFYKQEAVEYIPALVKKWSKIMNLTYNKISFRKTKRQWGSCSSKNNLSFNTMMMKLPIHVIEYIIVHELAHIKHKHHQKEFWNLVAQYIPDYKEHIHILKQYST